MPSSLQCQEKLHVAIIMDGNGRWATARGLARAAGHEAGIEALRRVVRAAPDENISILTVYAFSSDNWKRPESEVAALLDLFRRFLDSETEDLVRDGIKLSIVGRRDRLPQDLVCEIERVEAATEWGDLLHLRVALDYSARDMIVEAAKKAAASGELSRDSLTAALGAPDVDLLIRSSGEQRLSDFLLWECAYAELHFSPKPWPDFAASDLKEAMASFHHRERRFGALQAA
ncbi:MAG: di-trans,poly-cis-decaprenylcistransferase [Rhizomicrobium sp.]|nr:di-trans,poly-cis-decaprenylcistransferase [Rhizomicrobium sp.]